MSKPSGNKPNAQTVALIPARGGSKGLPGKNIKPLMGKPMIHYTVEAAIHCPFISETFVSTDDPLIAEVAQAAGALLPPLRPAALATDTASSLDVVRHFLDWYREEFGAWPDTLVLLQPTSPLRDADHVSDAMALYRSCDVMGTVLSVSPAKPLAWQGTVDPEGQFCFHHQTDLNKNRQSESANYLLNGALYIASPQRFYGGVLMQDPVYPFIMSTEDSVDIDTLSDFKLAEFHLSQRLGDETPPTPVLEA